MKNDRIARLILRGVIAQLREAMKLRYKVPMHAVSAAYAEDYVEYMVLEKDIDKVIKDLEEAVGDNDAQWD